MTIDVGDIFRNAAVAAVAASRSLPCKPPDADARLQELLERAQERSVPSTRELECAAAIAREH